FAMALLTLPLAAQPTLIPAPPQEQPVLITGATIHVGNGQVIEQGALLFSEGKIAAVGSAGTVSSAADVAGALVIEAAGKHVYPGFIACHTIMGLAEIE